MEKKNGIKRKRKNNEKNSTNNNRNVDMLMLHDG